ncbi:MAG: shikimate dehydrogenase [Cardiobacteriaceae bacterium]|nr:shikimate dehydrogenase [Cardiobacteriaceae bacterium]
MTYHCAVLGNPIAHSQSPEIHARFAREHGIALDYTRILVEPGHFASIVRDFFARGGTGLNVTLPCKEEAFALATRHTPYAQTARAANTLWMADDELWADNTDGRGLVRALSHDHQYPLQGKRILLLGAGGAARGVVLPLCEAQPAVIHIANRTLDKAQAIVAEHAHIGVPLEALALDGLADRYDLIINATSAGLSGAALALPDSIHHEKTLAYDMVYGKDTPFLAWARARNLAAHDGHSMLVNQAYLSFCQWFQIDSESRP